jgi:hypothetical protein
MLGIDGDFCAVLARVEVVVMRPRLSVLGLSVLGMVLVGSAAAPAARAQSHASNIPSTWSTDPGCGAQALRLTIGGNALAIERNGHVIFRGAARLAISDDEIAIRLGTEPPHIDPARTEPERNTIRFSRAGEALRLVSLTVPGAAQFARVPPLYPCQPAVNEANGVVMLPTSATLPAPTR